VEGGVPGLGPPELREGNCPRVFAQSKLAFETIHDEAWLAVIVISAVNFGFWQKLQLVSCILPLTLQEQKVNQSLTQASA